MVKRSRLSKKQNVGFWQRLKGDVRGMPYLIGGTAGMGVSLAGSAVFPPFALGALPSAAAILYQPASMAVKSIEKYNRDEMKLLKGMTKNQRYDYLMQRYGHGLAYRKIGKRLV
jgi:hypothetical protein